MVDTISPRDFAVRLWDGTLWPSDETDAPRFTVHVKSPSFVRELLSRPSLVTIGKAYVEGDLAIEGDLKAAFAVGERWINGRRPSLGRRLLDAWSRRPALPTRRGKIRSFVAKGSAESESRTRDAVTFFYDTPGEFFGAWLDPSMVYTCAYFGSLDDGLAEAQERKLDHVCKKLLLRPGDELLDIGCGWGALIAHAAQRYGVRAHGITLSEPQAEVARRRIASLGLADRCRVEVRDFRRLEGEARFDKISSIGMIEHVRDAVQPLYYGTAWRLLRDGGLMLNHGMTRHRLRPLRGGHEFLKRYLIPDHELIPLCRSIEHAEVAGFDVRDVEQMREHYGLTLDVWTERMRAAAAPAQAVVGEAVYRAFEIQMVSMAHHFYKGNLGLYQTLLSKPKAGDACVPLTRDHLTSSSPRTTSSTPGRREARV
jgi:cyclopropane-fatty-acyl-phospholipid synthase